MKFRSYALALPVIAVLSGCASDSDRSDESYSTPAMESIPNPNGTPSQAQSNQDSHGWGENIQNATGGRQ